MRALTTLGLFSVLLPFAAHSGENVTYQVDGMEFEGYWSEASDQAPPRTFNTRLGWLDRLREKAF